MNILVISGRTTGEPEVRYSQGNGNLCIANITLAVDRQYSKGEEKKTDFFRCTAFGKTAEAIEKMVGKGVKLMVKGRIEVDEYTDKSGNKRSTPNVTIEAWEFCESKKQDSAGTAGNKADTDGFLSIPEGISDELPFA